MREKYNFNYTKEYFQKFLSLKNLIHREEKHNTIIMERNLFWMHISASSAEDAGMNATNIWI